MIARNPLIWLRSPPRKRLYSANGSRLFALLTFSCFALPNKTDNTTKLLGRGQAGPPGRRFLPQGALLIKHVAIKVYQEAHGYVYYEREMEFVPQGRRVVLSFFVTAA